MLFGIFPYIFRPDRCLYLTNVGFTKEKHTDSGLSDSSSDSIWKFSIQKCFLEWKFCTTQTVCNFKLFLKRFFIHTDTHTG